MTLPQEIIRKKRDGGRLERAEIDFFVAGLTRGTVSDAQAAAMAMAILLRGMESGECASFTQALARSGAMLDWRAADLPGPAVDKHSTGGIGDLVSLVLAPAAAACGLYVPMIAGRGLGHTGGTIDKLEAIPGYEVEPGADRFIEIVKSCGCAIIGQTRDLAPADKKLYAIRDVTATVESIPLITASILSKKLAAGLDALVMDVKMGSGAFLPSLAEAQALAASILSVGVEAGLAMRALITDMNEPLASAAGNALEVAVAIDCLTGRQADPRLLDVVFRLGVEMLLLAGVAVSAHEAERRLREAISSGAAAERFARMVAALGGPADFLERPQNHLAQAPIVRAVHSLRPGFVGKIDARALGLCVVGLGGGRRAVNEPIDPSVGLDAIAGIGAVVDRERPICRVHARSENDAAAAAEAIVAAYRIEDAPPRHPRPAVIACLGAAAP
ncbi:thymidine phosphorylase [Methylocapsa acidiphila]|uniref:thymidine phosphorylase n=1 Tax=Methylocapsa acidiphila TaxID=133552 RepID=UPI0004010332|nr:thymidine phosphorylase [Methylocapsa acidiphila]